MDPERVNAVLSWETPKSVKDVQCFLGFANFYRRFILKYSNLCQPLFNLLRKDVPFNWDSSCDLVFQQLKTAFTSAPVLRHFDPDLETIIETDASDYVTSGILSQKHLESDKLVLHPVAFISEKMSPAECNYGIGDKELLAIMLALEKWHMYLHQLPRPFTIITDHHNLQTFTTKALLSRRQARWAQELAQYDFKIVFRPGAQNGKADALTRRSGDLPEEGDERARPVQALIPAEKFSLSATSTKHDQDILDALSNDPLAQEIFEALRNGSKKHKTIPLGECQISEGLLLINNLVYVPDTPDLFLRILKTCHDHPAAGHPGQAATYELVSRDYWWPKMRQTIAQYVRNCDTCTRIKPVRHAPYGLLKPLQVPFRKWSSVSLDLVTGLPMSNGFDALLVVVDRLSKMAHYIPTTTDVNSKQVAKLFFDNVFRLHGIPDSIVSDRGTQFVSELIRALTDLVGIQQKVSTAFHPQTDGQTERINAIAEQYLRAYCNYQQDNWSELLTMAEFSYNNTVSATLHITPFQAMYGNNPRYQINPNPAQKLPAPSVVKEYADRLAELDSYLKSEMTWAQATYSEQANKSRIPAPKLEVGDEVWLLRRHVKTTRPSTKLDYKRLGKFRIIQKVSSHAYKLDLPASMKIHPVFHISLLEPASTDPLPSQTQPPPPPIIVNDEPEWEVDEIVDSRFVGRTLQYLARWVGYDQLTWEPANLFWNSPSVVKKFHASYPSKPRSRTLPK